MKEESESKKLTVLRDLYSLKVCVIRMTKHAQEQIFFTMETSTKLMSNTPTYNIQYDKQVMCRGARQFVIVLISNITD